VGEGAYAKAKISHETYAEKKIRGERDEKKNPVGSEKLRGGRSWKILQIKFSQHLNNVEAAIRKGEGKINNTAPLIWETRSRVRKVLFWKLDNACRFKGGNLPSMEIKASK